MEGLLWWERVIVVSCLTLGGPMDCSLPGFPVHGILQARILEWVAISYWHERSQLQRFREILPRLGNYDDAQRGPGRTWATKVIRYQGHWRCRMGEQSSAALENMKGPSPGELPLGLWALLLSSTLLLCAQCGVWVGEEQNAAGGTSDSQPSPYESYSPSTGLSWVRWGALSQSSSPSFLGSSQSHWFLGKRGDGEGAAVAH